MSILLAVENLYEGIAYWFPRLRTWEDGHFEPAGLLALDQVWRCDLSAPAGAKVRLTCEVYLANRTYKGVVHSDWVTVNDSESYICNYLEARLYKSAAPLQDPGPTAAEGPPRVKLIEPSPVQLGGTIVITGEYFAVSPSRNWVWFEGHGLRFELHPTTRDPTKITLSLGGSDPLTMPQYAGDWQVSVERVYDHAVSNKVTINLALPEPVCTDGDKKCENGELYYCEYGTWWLWERDSPECGVPPSPPPEPPPAPPPQPPSPPAAPHIDKVYPTYCELDGQLNIIGTNFSSEKNRNWIHLVRSGYGKVLTMPDAASTTNLQLQVSKIAYALAPGSWQLYVETVIDGTHYESDTVGVTFGQEPAPPTPPPGAAFTLETSVTPEGGGWIGRTPSQVAYEKGTRVKLNALPAADYEFDHWAGDASGTADTVYVTMDSDKYVIGNFQSTLVDEDSLLGQIVQWIRNELSALRQWFDGLLDGLIGRIRAALEAAWTTLTAPITAGVSWLKDKIPSIVSGIQNLTKGIQDIVSSIWSSVSGALTQAISQVWTWLSSAASGIIEDVKTRLEVVKNVVWTYITNLGGEIWQGLTVVRDFLHEKLIENNLLLHALQAGIPPLLLTNLAKIELTGTDIMGHQDLGVNDLKEFVETNIADPILDAINSVWTWFGEWFNGQWLNMVTGIKRLFTETIPGWIRTAWEALKEKAQWLWDQIASKAGDFLENILGSITHHSPIMPEDGMGTLKNVVKIGLGLAGGLGIMTLLGNLVHPLHSLGLEHISAMVYDMTNYKLLIGAGMAVIATASIRTPMTYYINSQLRPNLPGEGPAAEMYNRELINFGEYSKYLSQRGYADFWHEPLARLTETPIKYFGLAAVARGGYFDHAFFENDLKRGGYSPDTRAVLLDMYSRTASESVRGIMSGTAIKRFKEGFTSESQFEEELRLLGYSPEQFPGFLAAAKLDYAYDYLTDLLTAYRDAVRKGHIDLDGYRSALLGLGMVPERVEGYILRERARLKPTEALVPISPSRPEYETEAGKVKLDTIRRQRRKELISRNQEISELQMLGIDPDYATAIADNDDIRLTKSEE